MASPLQARVWHRLCLEEGLLYARACLPRACAAVRFKQDSKLIPRAAETPDVDDEGRRLETLVLDDEFIFGHPLSFPAKAAEAFCDCAGRLPCAAPEVEHVDGDDIRASLLAALVEHDISADSEGVDGNLGRRAILCPRDATRGEQHDEAEAGQSDFHFKR